MFEKDNSLKFKIGPLPYATFCDPSIRLDQMFLMDVECDGFGLKDLVGADRVQMPFHHGMLHDLSNAGGVKYLSREPDPADSRDAGDIMFEVTAQQMLDSGMFERGDELYPVLYTKPRMTGGPLLMEEAARSASVFRAAVLGSGSDNSEYRRMPEPDILAAMGRKEGLAMFDPVCLDKRILIGKDDGMHNPDAAMSDVPAGHSLATDIETGYVRASSGNETAMSVVGDNDVRVDDRSFYGRRAEHAFILRDIQSCCRVDMRLQASMGSPCDGRRPVLFSVVSGVPAISGSEFKGLIEALEAYHHDPAAPNPVIEAAAACRNHGWYATEHEDAARAERILGECTGTIMPRPTPETVMELRCIDGERAAEFDVYRDGVSLSQALGTKSLSLYLRDNTISDLLPAMEEQPDGSFRGILSDVLKTDVFSGAGKDDRRCRVSMAFDAGMLAGGPAASAVGDVCVKAATNIVTDKFSGGPGHFGVMADGAFEDIMRKADRRQERNTDGTGIIAAPLPDGSTAYFLQGSPKKDYVKDGYDELGVRLDPSTDTMQAYGPDGERQDLRPMSITVDVKPLVTMEEFGFMLRDFEEAGVNAVSKSSEVTRLKTSPDKLWPALEGAGYTKDAPTPMLAQMRSMMPEDGGTESCEHEYD